MNRQKITVDYYASQRDPNNGGEVSTSYVLTHYIFSCPPITPHCSDTPTPSADRPKRLFSPGMPRRQGAHQAGHSSTGQQQPQDMKTRYWSFMFDKLRRAVDAIYDICFSDRSIVECKVSDVDVGGGGVEIVFRCCRGGGGGGWLMVVFVGRVYGFRS